MTGIHQKANLTIFEPRLSKCHREDLVPPLASLIAEVELLARYALLKHADSVTGGESYPPTLELLSGTARALASGDASGLVAQKQNEESDAKGPNQDASTPTNRSYLTEIVYRHAQRVRDAAIQWLTDLNSKTGNGASGKHNCLLALLQPLVPVKRLLVEAPSLPTRHPKRWDLRALLWAIKYASGYVALLALSVYVPSYRFFGVGGSEDNSVYTGWQLLAYAFSWTPTAEGTAKRGLGRLAGTLLGGACAWVGMGLAGVSFGDGDEDGDLHPVAVAVWIVYFCVLAGYGATEPGPAAMMGSGPNLGVLAKYFVATLALCTLEVYAQVGSRNEVVPNRVVATLTGVAFALAVQGIPPHTKGNDPELFWAYLEALRDVLASVLQAMITGDGSTERHDDGNDESEAAKLKSAMNLGKRVRFLVKDASAFQALPLLRIDSRIAPLLESMQVTESLLSALIEVESKRDRSDPAFSRDYRDVLEQLDSCMAAMMTEEHLPSSDVDIEEEDIIHAPPREPLVRAEDSNSAIVSASHLCAKRMHAHRVALHRITRTQLKSKDVADSGPAGYSSNTSYKALWTPWLTQVKDNQRFCGWVAASLVLMIAVVVGVQFLPPIR